MRTQRRSCASWAKNQFEDIMPGADELERIEKDVNQLLDDVKSEGEDVFKSIGDAVNHALGTGEVAPQGDGGLGQTADNFTQGGEVPAPSFGDPALASSRKASSLSSSQSTVR